MVLHQIYLGCYAKNPLLVKHYLGCHFAPNQLRGDLKLGLFGSVSIDIFIFCAQKFQKCTIHFVPMQKQETKGGGLRTAVAPALLLVSIFPSHKKAKRQHSLAQFFGNVGAYRRSGSWYM